MKEIGEFKRQVRVATDLGKIGTKFRSYLKRVRDEAIADLEDWGRIRRIFI